LPDACEKHEQPDHTAVVHSQMTDRRTSDKLGVSSDDKILTPTTALSLDHAGALPYLPPPAFQFPPDSG